jgi:hypothetical protein
LRICADRQKVQLLCNQGSTPLCWQQGFRTLPSSQFESPVRRGCQANDYRCSGRGDGGHLSRKGCRRREYRPRSRMRAAFSGLSAAAQRSFAPPCEVFVACGRYKGDPPRDPHASRLFRSFSGGSAELRPPTVCGLWAVGQASRRACEPRFQVFRRRLSGASPSYRVRSPWLGRYKGEPPGEAHASRLFRPFGGGSAELRTYRVRSPWPAVGTRASLPARRMRADFSGLSAAAQPSFALSCEVSVASGR